MSTHNLCLRAKIRVQGGINQTDINPDEMSECLGAAPFTIKYKLGTVARPLGMQGDPRWTSISDTFFREDMA